MIKILFFGDIVGRGGRSSIKTKIPELITKYSPDVIIANGENASGGFGIDLKTCDEIFASGVQIITSGNHIWKKKDIIKYLNNENKLILRPANFPKGAEGVGHLIYKFSNGLKLGVANLMGRVFMGDLIDCPFRCADEILANEFSECDFTLFDFHAEASSEKIAFGMHLDGRASVVLGTHTHVQTADERELSNGTLYITDVGMCGPLDSVIGMEKDAIINKFLSGISSNFGCVSKGNMQVCGVFIDLNLGNKKIERIRELINEK